MTTTAIQANKSSHWERWLPLAVFVLVFVFHALYIRHESRLPAPGWANASIVDNSLWGFGPYLRAHDYFTGFSYALGAAFAAWAIAQFIRQRRAAMAAGAVGSISLVALLMAGGCFLIGCCGSPMLAVYLSIFGAKALGVGKPLMAVVTLVSTGWGYYYLSPRFRKRGSRAGAETCCSGSRSCCADSPAKPGVRAEAAAGATGNACGCDEPGTKLEPCEHEPVRQERQCDNDSTVFRVSNRF